jgi:hypothetical protein
LISLATTLNYIVDCHCWKLQWVYEGFCFIHVMFKACQYVTNDNKIVVGLKNVSVKNAIKNYTLAFYFMIFQKIKEGKARMREGMC